MLKSLSVSNLAIIERAEVEFGPGLNVITGETGAGKSVLMGALDLVLGGRADASSVRDGAVEAEVEAVFSEEAAVEGEERTVVVRRTVTREGRSRAWIDDESVSIAELRTFAESRVDIHGPRSNQKILDQGFQREALDLFGGVKREAFEAVYREYAEVKREREVLASSSVSEDELDMLRYQVNEIESARLTDEDETIAERHAAASHAADIVAAANEITEGLGGDRGAAETLARLQPLFVAAARHFPAAAEWARTAEDLTIGIQELSRTVADAVSSIDADPATLDALDARLTLVNRLKRKYGDPLARLAEKKARLNELEHREERLAELDAHMAEAFSKVKAAGARITQARLKAGVRLAKAVTDELHDLGFLKAEFSVGLLTTSDDPSPTGFDTVTYDFQPNPGEMARPLAHIASSGEIARVMLALKVVIADSYPRPSSSPSPSPTLVFDEIDANIGGETAAKVGSKMRGVARRHQVIAITHLPQSAVYGARHLVVSKSVEGGRTRTHVKNVEGAERVAEIARMLGGEKLTSVVKRHAEELLEVSR